MTLCSRVKPPSAAGGSREARRLFYAVILALTAAAAQARDGNAIRSEILAQSDRSWDGATLPAYPPGEPEITILRVVIPPGYSLPWHRHPFINAGVLLGGELTVETESGKTFQLKVGDGIVELVNTWHHGINRGDVPAEIIVFYAGVKGSPVTLEKPQQGDQAAVAASASATPTR